MSKVGWTIEPGGLSNADKDAIFDAARRGKTAGQIARHLRKHPSTVAWFMYQNGLKRRKAGAKLRATHMRSGVFVRTYGPNEDALIAAMRADGESLAAIAAKVLETFGHRRSSHSLHVRLTMLASYESVADRKVAAE